MVLDNSLGSDVILALIGIAGHQDWHILSDDMVPKHQHVPRWQSRPQTSAQPLIITGPMDIDTDLGCGRATIFFFRFVFFFFNTIQHIAVTQSHNIVHWVFCFLIFFLKSCSVYQEHKIDFKHYFISEIERITQFENTPYGVSASALRKRDNIPPRLGVGHKREGSPAADGMG